MHLQMLDVMKSVVVISILPTAAVTTFCQSSAKVCNALSPFPLVAAGGSGDISDASARPVYGWLRECRYSTEKNVTNTKVT